MNSQWYEDKFLVGYILKKNESIIYYFTRLIDIHDIEGLIIIQIHFDNLQ